MDARAGTNDPRPALKLLSDEQQRVLTAFLDGLETYRGLLEWCHAVTFYSAGLVDERLLTELPYTSRDRVPTRVALGVDFEPEVARQGRQRIAATFVVPPFNRAIRELRWGFTVYGENPPDPEDQEHIVMRPALDELRRNQSVVLRDLLDGFDSQDEILEWGQDLSRATLGEADDEYVSRIFSGQNRAYRRALLGTLDDPEAAELFRYQEAAKRILPWFRDAVREQAARASEQPAGLDDDELAEYELDESDLVAEDTRDGRGG